jgi:hypothetical protein
MQCMSARLLVGRWLIEERAKRRQPHKLPQAQRREAVAVFGCKFKL